MGYPGRVRGKMAQRNFCTGSPTVSTSVLTPTLGTCAPGTGLTYSAAFTISGSFGSAWKMELWIKSWKDAESEPAFTYDSAVGRFTSSPQTPSFEVPTSGSDGSGTSHTYRRKVEFRVVPESQTPGSSDICDSLASSQTNTAANDCTI